MKSQMKYPAIFSQESDGITITFPDLKGCISCATTFSEAYDYVKEAMSLYLSTNIQELPIPTKLEDINLKENEQIKMIEI